MSNSSIATSVGSRKSEKILVPDCAQPVSWSEAERLAALDRYDIIGTARETAFDDVVALAADILEAPIAVMNLIAADRQWFKAEIGIGTDTLPLDASICRHAILQPGVLVVPDLSKDVRFDGNPLVHNLNGLRFYAGALLETPEGLPLGTICVLDTVPRPSGISERQERSLKVLAGQAMAQLELRRSEAIAKREWLRADTQALRLSLLSDVSTLLLSNSDARQSLPGLFALAADRLNLDVAFHYKCDRHTLQLVASYGLTNDQQREATQIEFGQSICGIVAETRQARYITAIQSSTDPQLSFAKALGLETYLSLPLLASDTLLGTVSFGKISGSFSEGELATLRTLGEQLVTALERQQAEDALRNLNADLERQVIERTQARGRSWAFSPDLMGALNPQGYFETSNPAWFKMLGWTEPELRASSIWDLIHPDDLDRTRKGFAINELRQPVVNFQNRYRSKSGAYRWISWVGVFEGGFVYCTGRDITVEREQAAALAKTTTERDRVWTGSRDIFVIADSDGVILAVNPAWERLLGYTPQNSIGHSLREFIWSEDLTATADEISLVASGATRDGFRNRYRAIDGSVRWIEWNTTFENNQIYGYGRDITAEKARIAELEQTQEALRHAQKMEAMGQLTGGVAHDFNNLLTPIVYVLDMIEKRVSLSEREQKLISAAAQSAARATTLVHRLLSFARRQPLQTRAVDIPSLINGMTELIATSIGSHIELEIDIGAAMPSANVDPNQLEMAILNLSVNARDAMPTGGTITIAALSEELSAPNSMGLPAGNYIRLSHSDDGLGMDDKTRAQAVVPFFSTKDIGQGTGLGLSMVHGLMSQLGGAMTIHSNLGQGTTINLWLPTLEQSIVASTKIENRAIPKARAAFILLVDDDDAVRASIADMLTQMGHEVVEAQSGREALACIERGAHFDAVVTDHLMSGMTGVELAQEARNRRPDLPVLIVSGYADLDGIDANIPRLTKPVQTDELADWLNDALSIHESPQI